MEKTINIVCAADDRYAPLCGIMLTSLFESNRDSFVNAYILTSGFGRKNTKRMNNLVKRGGYNGAIHICEVDDRAFEKCPVIKRWSRAAYYRLMVTELLPSDMGKVIYLDCDLLVNGSIQPLFETDLSGYAIAACDEDFEHGPEYQDRFKLLEYPERYGYFNSGVLLINLTYWRMNNVSDQLIQYVAKYPERLLSADQDALNGVLCSHRKSLPNKYNVYVPFLFNGCPQTNKDYLLKERPVILHYCEGKPWDWFLPDYPFRPQWNAARRHSPWRFYSGTSSTVEKLRRKLSILTKRYIGKTPKIYDDAWKAWAE